MIGKCTLCNVQLSCSHTAAPAQQELMHTAFLGCIPFVLLFRSTTGHHHPLIPQLPLRVTNWTQANRFSPRLSASLIINTTLLVSSLVRGVPTTFPPSKGPQAPSSLSFKARLIFFQNNIYSYSGWIFPLKSLWEVLLRSWKQLQAYSYPRLQNLFGLLHIKSFLKPTVRLFSPLPPHLEFFPFTLSAAGLESQCSMVICGLAFSSAAWWLQFESLD